MVGSFSDRERYLLIGLQILFLPWVTIELEFRGEERMPSKKESKRKRRETQRRMVEEQEGRKGDREKWAESER